MVCIEALKATFKEYFPIKRSPSTTDIFFDKNSSGFIPPDSDVLVVGPGIESLNNINIPMDRAPIALAPYLKKGGGSITVFDAPNDSNYYVCGVHNLKLIQQYFENLATVLPICDMKYVYGTLTEGDLGNLQPEQFDFVHDHLTTDRWILMFTRSEEDISKKVEHVVNVYKNLLRKGGSVFMHYCQETVYNHRNIFMTIFENAGFLVTDISAVDDKYFIPDELKTEFSKEIYANRRNRRRKILSKSKKINPYYKSTGILIAQKR